jgi:molybdenum cofactor guanylyltransferase
MREHDYDPSCNIPETTGVILAGGQGRRIGGHNKGLVLFNNRPLVSYCAEHLRPQVQSLMIIANHGQERYRAWSEAVYGDEADLGFVPGTGGPLLGLASALRHATTPWVAVMPCDSPGLSKSWVTALVEAAIKSDRLVAYLQTPARSEFLHCVIHSTLLSELENALQQSRLAVHHLWKSLGALPYAWPENLLNLNAPCDLASESAKIATNVK